MKRNAVLAVLVVMGCVEAPPRPSLRDTFPIGGSGDGGAGGALVLSEGNCPDAPAPQRLYEKEQNTNLVINRLAAGPGAVLFFERNVVTLEERVGLLPACGGPVVPLWASQAGAFIGFGESETGERVFLLEDRGENLTAVLEVDFTARRAVELVQWSGNAFQAFSALANGEYLVVDGEGLHRVTSLEPREEALVAVVPRTRDIVVVDDQVFTAGARFDLTTGALDVLEPSGGGCVALTETHAYWTADAVLRAPRTGGPVTRFRDEAGSWRCLDTDRTWLYLANRVGLTRIDTTSGFEEIIAPDAEDVMVTGQDVVWSSQEGIWRSATPR